MAQKPQHIRVSPVDVTIWTNNGPDDSEFKVADIKRSYKDAESGEFKSTTTLRTRDIPKAILALQKAYERMAGITEN